MISVCRLARSNDLRLATMLVFCILLFCPGTACASSALQAGDGPSFYIRPWTVDDGTAANTVVGAVRREDGYLWVATRTGLFRFDGEAYLSFKPVSDASLPGIVTSLILSDRRGRLWLAKDSGAIACVDGGSARIYSARDGLPPVIPVSMAEDGEGSIWLSYASGPLARIKDSQVQLIDAAAGMPGEDPVWLAADPGGQIWFMRERRVGVLRDGHLTTLLALDHAAPRPRIATARRGGVWISDGQQIWKCREGRPLEPLGCVPSGNVKLLYEDRAGLLWLAAAVGTTPPASLFCHDGRGFRQVPVECPGIMNLSQDYEGNVWVSTRRAGLIQVRPRTIELVNPVPSLPPDSVLSFAEDTNGIRFACGAYGLTRWQGAAWERLDEQHGWFGNGARCVAADPRGGVWIGTANRGLFLWRDGTFSEVGDPNVLATAMITSLLPSSNGDLWIGQTWRSTLTRLRAGRIRSFTFALPSSNDYVCAMAEDAQGAVWTATMRGLLLRAGEEGLVNETPRTISPPEPIRSLLATADGSLWIGYATRGLGRLRKGSFHRFGLERGLPDEVVTQILPDDRGWLWCAGDRGLFSVKMDELEAVASGKIQRVRAVLRGRDEGWPVLQASREAWPGAARTRTGTLWMPLVGGLAVIHPERCIERPAPSVVIERLTVNGRIIAAYDCNLQDSVDTAPPLDLHGMTNILALGRGVRQLSLEFAATSFTGRENVRFRYRLEGLDEAWVDAGHHRVAYFSQVPPGDYRFQVIGCGNDGTWNETGTRVEFTVAPFYWQTWWFRLLTWLAAGVTLGGAVWLETRRRSRRKLEHLERQRALERERARIARDIHDDLGANLTRLSMLSQPADGLPETLAESAATLAAINQNVRTLTQAMDEIVWAVNPRYDTLASLANYFGSFAQEFLEHSSTRCLLDMPLKLPDLPVTAEVRHHLFLAFKEALNNIAKHSQATEVCFALNMKDGQLTLAVTDNGRGLPAALASGSADSAPTHPADGYGLANMRRRLEEIGGECEILSQPGIGTRITFRVPLPLFKP